MAASPLSPETSAPFSGAIPHAVGDDLAGERLDTAVRRLCPGLSLRAARRAIERGGVLLNGRPATAARRLRPGQSILLADLAADTVPQETSPAGRQGTTKQTGPNGSSPEAGGSCHDVRLLPRQGNYLCLHKPAGLHSVSLAGDNAPSLERCCRTLLDARPYPAAQATLLQRLDFGTSGLVCVALCPQAVTDFRRAEADGLCHKRYVALLDGILPGPLTADRLLDTRRRRLTRVLDTVAPPLRQTRLVPLQVLRGEQSAALLRALYPDASLPSLLPDLTLAGCSIRCGARHQIRVHAASLGFPLWGDPLYHPAFQAQVHSRFHLHHGLLDTPWGCWKSPPPWNLSPQRHFLLTKWLETAGQ